MRENHHVFEHLIAQCRDLEPIAVAVAFPDDDVSLLGALEAARQRLIVPVLVGPRSRILAVAQSTGQDISAFRIVEADSAEAAAAQAVALCRKADCAALMKGSLHTDVLMHEVVKADTGLRGASRLSHVFVMDVPNYPKLLLITDAAINIAPSLEEKAAIVQNAIDLAHVLGIDQPKVAILSAVETVTPKIASTIDAGRHRGRSAGVRQRGQPAGRPHQAHRVAGGRSGRYPGRS
jgi:phosphate acetyltransferase